jgi:hypothetical protein
MNLEQLKKNVGHRVQLAPCACHLDAHGLLLPEVSEDWLIENVTDEELRLTTTTGHNLFLGKDNIHHYTTDRQRSQGAIKYGFLTLLVQPFIRGNDVWVKPTVRPGEPLAPPPVIITDKFVHFGYPTDSGLQQRLERLGFRLVWSRESLLPMRVDVEGWEVVVEPNATGRLFSFRVKDRSDDLILLRKRV